MAAFDVVIPTFNNLAELRRCLAALKGQSDTALRALVCVDGSTDGTLDYLSTAALPFPFEALSHPEHGHRGRAATRNLALPRLDAEFVLFLDSDMELEPGALAAHMALLGRVPCVSVGAVDYRNRSSNLWAKYISARRLNRYADGARLPYSQFMTANAAMRTADLISSGGFDESLAGYGGEDTELGYRFATQLRRTIVANQGARASSVEDKTLSDALGQLETYSRTNLHLIQARHPGIEDPFGTRRLHSRRLVDWLFRAVMNPLTDTVVGGLLPVSPFAIQEQLINYQVVRAVCRGYIAGEAGSQR